MNFDEIIERKNTYSLKWDIDTNQVIPLWVADMDFKTAPAVTQALVKRAESGVFGYTLVPEKYNQAVVGWWKKRFDCVIDPSWISLGNGVIPSLSAVIEALLEPKDSILIQTPVYNYFEEVVKNQDCKLLRNPLIRDSNGYWVDWEDFEEKISRKETKMFILCNPHNPVGKVFSKDELLRMGNICKENGVMVVADEIHRDLVYTPDVYQPFAFADKTFVENSITLSAPSKTFNLAGLKTANLLIANSAIRSKVIKNMQKNETNEPNVFGIDALIAAYQHGEPWLEELLLYLKNNIKLVDLFLKEKLPHVGLIKPQATYLLWLDCRSYTASSKEIYQYILKNEKVRINPGHIYGPGGEGFIRINIACPKKILLEGLEGIKRGLDALDKKTINSGAKISDKEKK